MRIKATYELVDKCISSVKAILAKNRTNSEMFKKSIGCPSDVIVTIWLSWLKGALYYCKNLPTVRQLVNSIDSKGILIEKAKFYINQEDLVKELLQIKECYEGLIPLLNNFEKGKYNIGNCLAAIKELNFNEDVVGLKEYISSRLKGNGILDIYEMSNITISPEIYAHLRSCPPTSIAVERSFSMLKKMLAKDRNFKEKTFIHISRIIIIFKP